MVWGAGIILKFTAQNLGHGGRLTHDMHQGLVFALLEKSASPIACVVVKMHGQFKMKNRKPYASKKKGLEQLQHAKKSYPLYVSERRTSPLASLLIGYGVIPVCPSNGFCFAILVGNG